MLKLLFRRVLQSIPLLLAISAVTFFLLFHSPGNYLSALKQNPKYSDATIALMTKQMGLDKPWYSVWGHWVWRVVTKADLGMTLAEQRPVISVLKERLFGTFILAFAATVFAWVIGMPLGMVAAVRHDRWPDRIASGIAFFGLSIPSVLLAMLCVYFASVSGWFPTGQMTGEDAHPELRSRWHNFVTISHHLVLPAFTLGMGMLAVYTRQMRSNLLETLQADYLRTALAKGLTTRAAVFKHALRNALNPLITLFGFSISELLSGAILVESVFAWPGLGRVTIEAYHMKDMFLVASAVIMGAVMLIIGNFIADILLAANDPRIRYE
ncbi:MAG: ABC transporter permease [Candidatus Sumerlaeaceae bacterium]